MKTLYTKFISEKTRLNIRTLVYKINSIQYLGNKVNCNCCNKKFKSFMPFGDSIKTKRLNAKCPWCLSLERTRMLWDFLNKSNLLKNNNKILHFGPAKILESKLKKLPSIDYLSADINPALAMTVVDITKIQFQNNTFDLIICGHILSDVKEDIMALSEMYRILKKGGTLIILELVLDQLETIEDNTITTEKERLKIYGNKYSLRHYGKDLASKISSAGFKVNEYSPIDSLSEQYIKQFGLQNSGILYLCIKEESN